MKQCSKCKIEKPFSEFWKHRKTESKLASWCKDCNRAARRNHAKLSTVYSDKKLFGGLREAVIQRDQAMCAQCGMTREEHKSRWNRDITVDHIDGRGINHDLSMKNNEMGNLITLCLSCHGKKDITRRRKFSEYSEESKKQVLANLRYQKLRAKSSSDQPVKP